MNERFTDGEEIAECTALDALYLGLVDAGIELVTGYPGFHAHDLVSRFGGTVSVNERTAFAVAWGAAVAGLRSAVAVKNVGLNDAADPFLNAHRLRTGAGMVVVVFDDVEVVGSQCRQDSRAYFDLAPGLWFEPFSASHSYWCARHAPALAERFGLPVVVRVTNALLRCRGAVKREAAEQPRKEFRRSPADLVAHPVNVRAQEDAMGRRKAEVAGFVESLYRWASESPAGMVSVRTGPRTIGQHGGERPELVLWTYPLPEQALGRHLRTASSIEVREQGGPFVREKIRALTARIPVGGEDIAIGIDHSTGYRVSAAHDSLFGVLRSFPDRVVVGDLGGFTLDPDRTIDACLCYGASVASAIGCSLGRTAGPVFCVTGDGAFLHSGLSCLEEGRLRGARVVVVVLDNGGMASTGGQVVPGVIHLPSGIQAHSVNFGSVPPDAYRRILGHLADRPGVSVLHVQMGDARP